MNYSLYPPSIPSHPSVIMGQQQTLWFWQLLCWQTELWLCYCKCQIYLAAYRNLCQRRVVIIFKSLCPREEIVFSNFKNNVYSSKIKVFGSKVKIKLPSNDKHIFSLLPGYAFASANYPVFALSGMFSHTLLIY